MSSLAVEAFRLRNELQDKQRDAANWQRLYERSEARVEELELALKLVVDALKGSPRLTPSQSAEIHDRARTTLWGANSNLTPLQLYEATR